MCWTLKMNELGLIIQGRQGGSGMAQHCSLKAQKRLTGNFQLSVVLPSRQLGKGICGLEITSIHSLPVCPQHCNVLLHKKENIMNE